MKKLVIGIVVSALLLCIGVYVYMSNTNKDASSKSMQAVNKIVEIDKADRQAQLNNLVKEGEINIQYSMSAIFNGTKSDVFNVKNIEHNKYPIVFSLYDEAGKLLFESEQIEPGYEVTSIELIKNISKGSHECRIKIGYAKEGNVMSTFPITIEVK